MAILSDVDLLRKLDDTWGIYPINPDLIGPASIDMRLGSDFYWNMPDGRVRGLNSELQDAVPNYTPFIVGEDEPADLFSTDPVLCGLVAARQNARYEDSLIIAPGQFVLATTQEQVWLSNRVVGRVEGRSSIGRLGITVHSTAGFIDPGFSGTITLEITNSLSSYVEIPVGTALCQLVLEYCSTPSLSDYGHRASSKYQGQSTTTLSRMEKKRCYVT